MSFSLPPSLRRLGGIAVNVALVYHLFAIVIAPATVPPSSELQRSAFLGAEFYLNALSLNHGYHYFAPDPGPSQLVEYRGVDEDGQVVSGVLPSRETRPRLLYHRYFMLTESQPQPDDEPALSALHRAAIRAGIGQHSGLKQLELTRVRHRLATPALIQAGLTLDDIDQYDRDPFDPPSLPRTRSGRFVPTDRPTSTTLPDRGTP